MGVLTGNFKTVLNYSSNISELEMVEMELINSLSDSRGTVREMNSHILNAGGKRLRPLLVLYSGMLFSENTDGLIKAAVAAELIHMASLVHDDIIDDSPLRRNKPSVNKVWGNYFAVLGGDYLFAKAFGILSSNRLYKSLDYMVEAIGNMCHGEIFQAEDRFNCDTNLEKYYEKIALKTAVFLKCCCESGAAISGAGIEETELLGEYGMNLGLAFQIIDDLLDFKGCVESMGKPRNEDLRQGNITLPIVLLLKHDLYGTWIRGLIEGKSIDEEVMEEICTVLKETGIMERCVEIAFSHIEKAKQSLSSIPGSFYKESLLKLADYLRTRVDFTAS